MSLSELPQEEPQRQATPASAEAAAEASAPSETEEERLRRVIEETGALDRAGCRVGLSRYDFTHRYGGCEDGSPPTFAQIKKAYQAAREILGDDADTRYCCTPPCSDADPCMYCLKTGLIADENWDCPAASDELYAWCIRNGVKIDEILNLRTKEELDDLRRRRQRSRLVVVPPPRKAPVKTVRALLDQLLQRQTGGGFAEWFFAKCGEDVRYVAEMRRWALWDGRRWMIDAAEAVHERAKEAIQVIVKLIPLERDQEKQSKMLRVAHRFDSIDPIVKMLKYAATDARVLTSIQDYDTDPWLLNVANGTIDLRSGALLVPRRHHLITKILEIQYDEAAAAPQWMAFLQRIMRGHPEVIPFLQRAVGYTLTGENREHRFFLLHGSGRNGKSTFVEALLAMLSEYAQSSNPETWLRQSGGRGPEPDIARLPGIRMVATAEIGEGRAIDEARVKAIVAGDRTTTRNLYKESFDFIPSCKLWISTNHAPQIRGNDEGMWRRVCLIPFDETISYDEMDRDLPRKLHAELPGILAWAVQGCLQWQRHGLIEPEVVRLRTDEYRTDQDAVGLFIEECCALGEDSKESGSALYAAYQEWARGRGERRPLSAMAFGQRLTDRGHENRKIHGVKFRIGLAFREESRADHACAS